MLRSRVFLVDSGLDEKEKKTFAVIPYSFVVDLDIAVSVIY